MADIHSHQSAHKHSEWLFFLWNKHTDTEFYRRKTWQKQQQKKMLALSVSSCVSVKNVFKICIDILLHIALRIHVVGGGRIKQGCDIR